MRSAPFDVGLVRDCDFSLFQVENNSEGSWLGGCQDRMVLITVTWEAMNLYGSCHLEYGRGVAENKEVTLMMIS